VQESRLSFSTWLISRWSRVSFLGSPVFFGFPPLSQHPPHYPTVTGKNQRRRERTPPRSYKGSLAIERPPVLNPLVNPLPSTGRLFVLCIFGHCPPSSSLSPRRLNLFLIVYRIEEFSSQALKSRSFPLRHSPALRLPFQMNFSAGPFFFGDSNFS